MKNKNFGKWVSGLAKNFLALAIVLSGTAQATPGAAVVDPFLRETFGERISRGWIATAAIQKSTPKGDYRMQAFQRLVEFRGSALPAGSVTLVEFPRPEGFDARSIGTRMLKAMGVTTPKTRRTAGAQVFEGLWEKGGRWVRLSINSDARNVRYSVAVMRYLYSEGTIVESEILQRTLAAKAFDGSPATAGRIQLPLPTIAWFAMFTAGQARAEGAVACTMNCNGLNPVAAAACVQAAANCQINNLQNTANSIADSMDGAVTEWSRTNTVLEKITNPAMLFALGAAGAAGAAVGGFVTSLALEGIQLGVKALIDLITMRKHEEQIVERFEKAREEYEKLTEAKSQVEQVIGQMLRIKAQSRAAGLSMDDYVRAYSAKKARLEIEFEDGSAEHARLVRSGSGCADEYYVKQVEPIRREVGNLNKVIDLLEKSEPFGRDVCGEAGKRLHELARIDEQLDEARAHLLAGRQTFLKKRMEEFASAQRALRESKSPGRYGRIQTRRERRERMKAEREMARVVRKAKRHFVRECAAKGERRRDCRARLESPETQEELWIHYLDESRDDFVGIDEYQRGEHNARMKELSHTTALDPNTFHESIRGWYDWFEQLNSELGPDEGALANYAARRAEFGNDTGGQLRLGPLAEQMHQVCGDSAI